jgi:hypothetical protein
VCVWRYLAYLALVCVCVWRHFGRYNVTVPVGRFLCAEHLSQIETAHLEIVHRMAERDGYTKVEEPGSGRTYYFHVDSTNFQTPRVLLKHYRRKTRGEPEIAQDCKIPFMKYRLQPNLNPEKYQLVNEYVRDVVARRCAEVFPDDGEQLEKDRKLRRSLYEKVTLAAGDPLVGGLCCHVVALATHICHLWSPTGLEFHPSVIQRHLDRGDDDSSSDD